MLLHIPPYIKDKSIIMEDRDKGYTLIWWGTKVINVFDQNERLISQIDIEEDEKEFIEAVMQECIEKEFYPPLQK